ncbi:hypothetical protein PHLCEN_2v9105 [Hermanssonia centrifuga]|uniref:Uncharacterized protein n=1 Tax=Hermanssonia centrifuga TaxID=98765 RepID=A0A2R6NRR5_9APHY|nr:hypothetical protein PHLCEN_2v9105 [Hermanssonia centrifuga]
MTLAGYAKMYLKGYGGRQEHATGSLRYDKDVLIASYATTHSLWIGKKIKWETATNFIKPIQKIALPVEYLSFGAPTLFV